MEKTEGYKTLQQIWDGFKISKISKFGYFQAWFEKIRSEITDINGRELYYQVENVLKEILKANDVSLRDVSFDWILILISLRFSHLDLDSKFAFFDILYNQSQNQIFQDCKLKDLIYPLSVLSCNFIIDQYESWSLSETKLSGQLSWCIFYWNNFLQYWYIFNMKTAKFLSLQSLKYSTNNPIMHVFPFGFVVGNTKVVKRVFDLILERHSIQLTSSLPPGTPDLNIFPKSQWDSLLFSFGPTVPIKQKANEKSNPWDCSIKIKVDDKSRQRVSISKPNIFPKLGIQPESYSFYKEKTDEETKLVFDFPITFRSYFGYICNGIFLKDLRNSRNVNLYLSPSFNVMTGLEFTKAGLQYFYFEDDTKKQIAYSIDIKNPIANKYRNRFVRIRKSQHEPFWFLLDPSPNETLPGLSINSSKLFLNVVKNQPTQFYFFEATKKPIEFESEDYKSGVQILVSKDESYSKPYTLSPFLNFASVYFNAIVDGDGSDKFLLKIEESFATDIIDADLPARTSSSIIFIKITNQQKLTFYYTIKLLAGDVDISADLIFDNLVTIDDIILMLQRLRDKTQETRQIFELLQNFKIRDSIGLISYNEEIRAIDVPNVGVWLFITI